jgi:hypothetical protein
LDRDGGHRQGEQEKHECVHDEADDHRGPSGDPAGRRPVPSVGPPTGRQDAVNRCIPGHRRIECRRRSDTHARCGRGCDRGQRWTTRGGQRRRDAMLRQRRDRHPRRKTGLACASHPQRKRRRPLDGVGLSTETANGEGLTTPAMALHGGQDPRRLHVRHPDCGLVICRLRESLRNAHCTCPPLPPRSTTGSLVGSSRYS